MIEPTTLSTRPGSSDEIKLGLLDILIIFAKNKRIIFALPVLAALISGAVSFLIPETYSATAKLLPPQQAQSGAAALLSQLGGAASAMAGSAGLKSPNDLYVGMLKSRTVADRLIKKLKLQEAYDQSSLEKTRKELADNTSIIAGKDGLITIEVEDGSKSLVAKIANTYVAELTNLTSVLAVTEASQRRVFFERQLELAKNNLASAEISLKSALDTHGVISVDSESRAIVETVGRVRAQISVKEIQLSSMRAFITVNNPAYRRVEEELSSLRSELVKLENGRPGASTGRSDKEQVGLKNIKILRDVKYYQMLYELLAKQYEVARLDEAKDAAVVQVLDRAIEPEEKHKPKRALIVLLATGLALLAALAYAFLAEMKERALSSSVSESKWAEFNRILRSK